MKTISEQKEFFSQLFNLLEEHYGKNSEIVLHDLTLDYEHTIVDIRNGHITGRKIGDCGSNLGLEVLRGTVVDGNRYNYITHTKDAKILRSSSLYIKDEDRVIGSICINSDITESVKFETYLHAVNNYSLDESEKKKEVFATNVKQLLEHFLTEGEVLVGRPAPLMNKDDRLKFLKYLDDNGAFLITKSSDRVCEFLNISRYTLYTYLDIIHAEAAKIAQEEKG